MTTRERNQATVITKLILERDAALLNANKLRRLAELAAGRADKLAIQVARRQRARPTRARATPRCVYCGRRVLDGRPACPQHDDLLALDPVYARPAALDAAA